MRSHQPAQTDTPLQMMNSAVPATIQSAVEKRRNGSIILVVTGLCAESGGRSSGTRQRQLKCCRPPRAYPTYFTLRFDRLKVWVAFTRRIPSCEYANAQQSPRRWRLIIKLYRPYKRVVSSPLEGVFCGAAA